MKIDELLVSKKLAFKLKNKGFDEKCIKYYVTCRPSLNRSYPSDSGVFAPYQNSGFKLMAKQATHATAPLYQQVITWFREKYNIEIQSGIVPSRMLELRPDIVTGKYAFYIFNSNWNPSIPENNVYSDDYNKGLELAIEQALKYI